MVCRRHHIHAPPSPSGVWGRAKSWRTRGRSLGVRRRPRRRDGRRKSPTLVRLLPHPARRLGRPCSLLTIVARDLRACQGLKGRENSPRALGGRAPTAVDPRCGGASFLGWNSVSSLLCPSLSLSPAPPQLLPSLSLLALSTSPSFSRPQMCIGLGAFSDSRIAAAKVRKPLTPRS